MTFFHLLLRHPLALLLADGLLVGMLIAAWAATADSKKLREDALLALRRSGWSIQCAASALGIARSQLYAQLEDQKPLWFLGRMDRLEKFEDEWIALRAERKGYVVVKHGELAELIAEVRQLVGKNRRMLKMERA